MVGPGENGSRSRVRENNSEAQGKVNPHALMKVAVRVSNSMRFDGLKMDFAPLPESELLQNTAGFI
eukprot:COSAG06_NODE_55924_length_287_cov_0.819149_1_plen_66_part_10